MCLYLRKGEKSKEQRDWDKHLLEIKERIEIEEKKLKEKIEKAIRLTKSFDLLRLCTELLREEGETWKISSERREIEKQKELERHDKLKKAGKKKIETLEKLKVKEKQTKITEMLAELPDNRRKMLEIRLEKERILDLKEAKERLWKKWRYSKGKKDLYQKIKKDKNETPESLENKLRKIEQEIENYKKELETIKKEKERKETKINKKKKKQEHWEMMKWLVQFIEENQEHWNRIRKEQEEDRELVLEMERWENMNRTEQINKILQEEKEQNKTNMKNNKERRLEWATALKKNWNRREPVEEIEEIETETVEHDKVIAE